MKKYPLVLYLHFTIIVFYLGVLVFLLIFNVNICKLTADCEPVVETTRGQRRAEDSTSAQT